ncbi:MAG: hypothetical protein K0R44_3679 [Thermomicrobiales bacterium]|nr:hypothetical protein [Thermomicrobiales bacterium]
MAVMNTLTLPDAPAAVATNEGSIFFIGNATVLIRVAGFTILTASCSSPISTAIISTRWPSATSTARCRS